MKQVIWFILSLILIPIAVLLGLFFFSAVAVIVIAIIALIIVLSFIIYLNRKFKFMLSKIGPTKTDHEPKKQKHTFYTPGKDKEVVVNYIEETIEEKEKRKKREASAEK